MTVMMYIPFNLFHSTRICPQDRTSPNVMEVYASDTIYDTYDKAKTACAAFHEGILVVGRGGGRLGPPGYTHCPVPLASMGS